MENIGTQFNKALNCSQIFYDQERNHKFVLKITNPIGFHYQRQTQNN